MDQVSVTICDGSSNLPAGGDQSKGQLHSDPSVTSTILYPPPLFNANMSSTPLFSPPPRKKAKPTKRPQHQWTLTWKRKLLQEVSILTDWELTRLGSETGREEGNRAEEEKLQVLLRQQSLRPVPARVINGNMKWHRTILSVNQLRHISD